MNLKRFNNRCQQSNLKASLFCVHLLRQMDSSTTRFKFLFPKSTANKKKNLKPQPLT